MERKFSVLKVTGTNKDLGLAIGNKFKGEIQERIDLRRKEIPEYESYLEKCQPYFDLTQKAFPELIEEIKAIAESADVPLMEYFFHNNRDLFDFYFSFKERDTLKERAEKQDHCTIAVSFGKEGAVVGHNEDWLIEAVDDYYILEANINGTKFLTLASKTLLPGDAAGVNNYGLVQCINELHTVSQIGIPKNFIARAILECKDLAQAENLIRNFRQASGFNHVLVQGNQVKNIEIAGNNISVQTITNNTFVHTNHYLSPELQEYEEYHTTNSEKRLQRARELVKLDMTPTDMMELLSDTKDSRNPICKKKKTLASLIFLPHTFKTYICYGPPCQGEYKQYQLK